MQYDVIIIGGGAAGFGCALTLASVENTQEWAKEKKYLLLDNGNSDILKASFFNVPGLELGIGGDTLLEKMQRQLSNFNSCETIETTAISLTKKDTGFLIVTKDGEFEAKTVVLATGMHSFDIKTDLVKVQEHTDVMKANKICLQNNDNKIMDGLYVAGLASGAKTMFAIASGEGSKVACQIFKDWTGKPAVAHDTLKDKLL